MKRREFIAMLGGAAGAWPIAARAQQQKDRPRLAFFPLGSPSGGYDQSLVEAFQAGLHRVGLIDNQNIALDVVWVGGGDPDQAVREALRRGAQLLILCGSSASVAAKRQTSIVPIVFLSVGDPIGMRLVESLPRPGHNATGFSDILGDLSGKLVDLARDLIKPQTTIGYLWHTAWPDGQNRYQATQQAAQAAGMTLQPVGIADVTELDAAVFSIKQGSSKVFIIQPSPFGFVYRERILKSAMREGLGTIYPLPISAKEGSLIGFGIEYLRIYSRAAIYVDRILKGIKPADLPVEQPTKLDLVINLRTARALSITVPQTLQVAADEVIE
jgi:putative ABC transport system substrate-binding protein